MAAETDWHVAFNAGQFISNCEETIDSFDAMNLKNDLLRGVYAYGFERPSGVQRHAMMPIIRGNDAIIQAQLDGDEIATLSIPLLQKIDSDHPSCQALILAPTRGLAQQIQEVSASIAQFTQIGSYADVEPANSRVDVDALRDGSQVVVSTPGRTYDKICRRLLNIDSIKTIVLDKVDEILSRGFDEHVSKILQLLSQSVQIVFFSTIMSQDVLELSMKFMQDPVRIPHNRIEHGGLTFKGIAQFCVIVEEEDQKLDVFSSLHEFVTATQAVIFCRLRRNVEWLANELTTRNFVVSAMHADLDAYIRQGMMQEFRSGSSRVLIATDMLARGIDVQQVSLVINYDIPDTCEKYANRIGRDGPSGRKGIVINLATGDEVRMMREIEQFYGTQIVEAPVNVASLMK